MKLSIIIAARTGSGPVLTCLQSLSRLAERRELEIVVGDCCGGGVQSAVQPVYPDVIVVQVPPGASIAQSRAAALARCTGEIVAVLHERYAVREDWVRAVQKAQESGCDVAGGCVAPSPGLSAAAWAMYLSEYSHICPPRPTGPLSADEAGMLPGGDVSYNRRALSMSDMSQALWELDFHQALLQAGARFVRGAGMDAEFAHPFTVREYIAERYEVSRDLAALRLRGAGLAGSLVSAVTRLALPAVLLARITGRVAKTPYGSRLLQTFPWILLFVLVQTYGEIVGSLAPKQLDRRGVQGAQARA